MNLFDFKLVSQEKVLFQGQVSAINAPGVDGELGVLANHTPLLTLLKPGQVEVSDEKNQKNIYYISGGILEVQPTEVSILCDVSIRAKDLDEQKILQAKKNTESLLQKSTKEDRAALKAELAIAAAKLQAIRALRKKQ